MSTQQVFLSYCHRDDEPYGPQNRRWVEEFEKALRESIGQRVGAGQIQVWRDKRRLTGNELFDPQIEAQLAKSAILVTVLSQHYLDSAYCKKEFQFFGREKLNHGGLHVDRLSRIVKVYRRAINRSQLKRFAEEPALVEELDGNTGFELYYKDENGVDRDVLLDPEKTKLYWQCADDIALAIKRIIDASTQSDRKTSGAIYLARTSSDMRELRESLRRELEDKQYVVLPSRELPEDAEHYKQAVREDLKSACMSVHLLGGKYGAILEGTQLSVVALQAELALEEVGHPFQTIFWASPDLPSATLSDPTHRALVESLEQSSFDAKRAEFVRAPPDQLKRLVLERLEQPPTAPPVLPAGRSIYLVVDAMDRAEAKEMQRTLKSLGVEVTRESVEGTPEELLEEHKANLIECDAVAIWWGNSRETWVKTKLRGMTQAPGWGRSKPFRTKVVVMAPPPKLAKNDFDPPSGVVILQASEVTEKLLPLLK